MANSVPVTVINDQYPCPYDTCIASYPKDKLNSFRRHCKRNHGLSITIKDPPLTIEEKRIRQRRYTAKHRAKNKKNTRKRKHVRRALYDAEDAEERGSYKCRRPLLEYKQSNIPNAGNGIFALEDLFPGDVVTWVSGKVIDFPTADKSYTIIFRDKYIDGLHYPELGKGLGSFINREERNMSKSRKNCEFVEYEKDQKIYIEITSRIKPGKELYITYGRGYRLKK